MNKATNFTIMGEGEKEIKRKSYFENFFKQFDILGTGPKLKILNKSQFKSGIGGVASIMIFTLVVFGFYYFGHDIIYKEIPITNYTIDFITQPERLDLPKSKFDHMIGIKDTNSVPYYDPTIYTLTATLLTITFNATGPHFFPLPLNITQCTRDHFINFYNIFPEDVPYSKYNCIDSFDNLYIEGYWGNPNFTFIDYWVYGCKNGTTTICKPQSVIDAILTNGYVEVQFTDMLFDPKNFTNPQKYINQNIFTSFTNTIYKSYEIYIKRVNFLTDQGWLFEDFRTTSYFQMEKNSYLDNGKRSDGAFLRVIFRMSQLQDSYFRQYIKIQNVIAQMGGLIKGVVLIFYYTIYFYQKTAMNLFIINSVFSFTNQEINLKEMNSNVSKTKNKKSSIIQIQNNISQKNSVNIYKKDESIQNLKHMELKAEKQQTSNFIKNFRKILARRAERHKGDNVNLQQIFKESIQGINLKRERIKYSFFDYIKNFLCNKKYKSMDKFKNYSIGEKKIDLNMDIINLIKKLNDLDILITTVLTEEQKKLFRYSSLVRQAVDNSEEEEIESITNQDELKLIYRKMKEEKDTISVNLISSLNKNLKELLE